MSVLPLLAAVLMSAARSASDTVRCPRYCTCYLDPVDNLRTVSCVAHRLDNIDLGIPKRAQSVDLSNNSISALEDRGFQNLGLIEVVNLSLRHNSIRTIGLHAFTGMPYLRWVDLTGNNLYKMLPWTFHENNNLKFLSLSSNPLGHNIPPGPLLDIPSLEVLEISGCNFAYLPEELFSSLPNIRKLDISHNQLINVDIYTLQYLPNLEELDVTKNPWTCNVNLKHVKEYLNSKSGKLIGSKCDSKEPFQQIQVRPAMFERIISVASAEPKYDPSVSEEDDNSSSDEVAIEKLNECICEQRHEKLVFPPKWIALISFQLGMSTALILGYFWIYCTKKEKKYIPIATAGPTTPVVTETNVPLARPSDDRGRGVESLHASAEILPCPETPPPSYRELFITS